MVRFLLLFLLALSSAGRASLQLVGEYVSATAGAEDSSGQGNDFTVIGAPTFTGTGAPSGTYFANGFTNADYLSTTASAFLTSISGKPTFRTDVWFRATVVGLVEGDDNAFFEIYNSGSGADVYAYANLTSSITGLTHIGFSALGSDPELSYSFPLLDHLNEWVHFRFDFDSGTRSIIYLGTVASPENTVLVSDTITATTTGDFVGGTASIGNYTGGGGAQKGDLNGIQIYAEAPTATPTPTPTPNLTPIGRWQGNTVPGQYVATNGDDLVPGGDDVFGWPSICDSPGMELDHSILRKLSSTASNTYAVIPDSALPITSGWTIQFRLNTDDTMCNWTPVFRDNGGPYFYTQAISCDGNIGLYFKSTIATDELLIGTIPTNDSIAHIIKYTGNLDGTWLYIDGVQSASSTAAVDWSGAAGDMHLGDLLLNGGTFGDVDDLQIYNAFNYSVSGTTGTCATTPTATPTVTMTPTPFTGVPPFIEAASINDCFSSSESPAPYIYYIAEDSGVTLGKLTLTSGSLSLCGTSGLARNPVTRILYAIVSVTGGPNRYLVSVNETTGAVTTIATMTGGIQALAFTDTGKCFTTIKTAPSNTYLAELNISTGATTNRGAIGAWCPGGLAFNASDGLLYYYNSCDPTNYKTISPSSPYTQNTYVNVGGGNPNQAMVMASLGWFGFNANDFSFITVAPDFSSYSTVGTFDNPDGVRSIKGLVYNEAWTPTISPTFSVSPTVTATITPSPSDSPTATPSSTISPTATETPSASPTGTVTETPLPTETPCPTCPSNRQRRGRS
jgi:hypothetical protein